MSNVFTPSWESLVTTHEAYRAGVLEIALFKSKESIPYLDKAKALYVTLKQETRSYTDILNMPSIHETILEAAGITQKTKKFLDSADKIDLLEKFMDKEIAPTGEKYVEEITYRYLMALGDQLSGHMRNCIGDLARGKLIRQIVAQLKISKIPFKFWLGAGENWSDGASFSIDVAESIKAMTWNNGKLRTFFNNVNVDGLSKNVDIVLIDKELKTINKKETRAAIADPKCFLMMGELKGGVDPAGADEHWKTARGALQRIRNQYKRVDTLFIGASIEKAMAREIFGMLTSGDLNCAANLTDDNQLSSACAWTINL